MEKILHLGAIVAFTSIASLTLTAQSLSANDHSEEAYGYVHESPNYPSEIWTLAAGGRIYDKWWEALDRDEPEGTNPAYPATGQKSGTTTWRCKECHGWDYMGKDGIYSGGSHYTGIPGIREAEGSSVEAILTTLRNENHPYTQEMITDAEMARVALFVSRGQVDMTQFLDMETRKVNAGNPDRGREIFQTICAACHGFDGRMLDWGDGDEHNFVGTEAVDVPDEVMHKVLSAHPGVQMINLRAFPYSDAIDVMAYAATLPTGE